MIDKCDKKLMAMLIGDGFVTNEYSIGIYHSIKQKQWVFHKIGILTSCGFTVRVKESFRESYGKMRKFIHARTNVSDLTKELRNLLYPQGKKIIPPGFLNDFGYEEWSIIYQDDGRQNKIAHYNTVKNKKRIRVECDPFVNRYDICSQGFNRESNLELQTSLLNLGIESSFNKVKGGYGKLLSVSRAKSKTLFYEGIKKYVLNDMKYKLSAKPHLAY